MSLRKKRLLESYGQTAKRTLVQTLDVSAGIPRTFPLTKSTSEHRYFRQSISSLNVYFWAFYLRSTSLT